MDRCCGKKAVAGGALRVGCVIVLAVMLSGCDRCGDWWWLPGRGDTQSCKSDTPRPN